jgi:hypothetical protein
MNIIVINDNMPDFWDFSDIKIENGKRNIDYFISTYKKNDKIKIIKIKNDDGSDFMNSLIKYTNATKETLLNTIKIYIHPIYDIEMTYNSDYNYTNNNFNYIATVINLEAINVYGDAIFFKINKKTKKIMKLELDELLSCLINFYYIKTYKLINNEFDEITLNNFEPEIERQFKDYNKKQEDNWEIYSENDIKDFNLKEKNDINKFNNIIFLKRKENIGEISNYLKKENKPINETDFRGIYYDLDKENILTLFN